MKCIQCGTDNRLKDRLNGKCYKCGHPFVFEPTQMYFDPKQQGGEPFVFALIWIGYSRITDVLFQKAIQDVSGANTLSFTVKQLYYLVEKRYYRKSGSLAMLYTLLFSILFLFIGMIITGQRLISLLRSLSTVFLLLVSVIMLALLLTLFLPLFLSFLKQNPQVETGHKKPSIIVMWAFRRWNEIMKFPGLNRFRVSTYQGTYIEDQKNISRNPIFSQNKFRNWLDKWKEIHPVPLLMEPSEIPQGSLKVSKDIETYSFDGLVVCGERSVAALLIANRFHFETSCAILSLTGYPEESFEIVMRMVKQNPDVKVYAFHSCTPDGIRLIHHLRTSPTWFASQPVTIIDVGLTPQQVLASPRQMTILKSSEFREQAKDLPREVAQTLTERELQWIQQGNYVELESFTPAALIRILSQSIAQTQSGSFTDNDSLVMLDDDHDTILFVGGFG